MNKATKITIATLCIIVVAPIFAMQVLTLVNEHQYFSTALTSKQLEEKIVNDISSHFDLQKTIQFLESNGAICEVHPTRDNMTLCAYYNYSLFGSSIWEFLILSNKNKEKVDKINISLKSSIY